MKNLKKVCKIAAAGTIGLGIFLLSNITIPSWIMIQVQKDHRKDILSQLVQKTEATETYEAPTLAENYKPSVKRLEDFVKEKANPAELNLSLDEKVLLGRLIPIKSIIEKYTELYDTNPIWFTQTLCAESFLFPLAYNSITEDYGLTQEKMDRYEHARKIVLNKKSKYYCGENLINGIYNPKTNIVTTLGLVKEARDDYNLPKENTDLLSVIYNKGFYGILESGEFTDEAKRYLSYINKMKPMAERIIQCFKFNDEERRLISDERTKEILSLYNPDMNDYEGYNKLFSFYMSKLDEEITPDNVWEKAVTINEALSCSRVMHNVYGNPNIPELERIAESFNNLKTYIKKYNPGELYNYISDVDDSMLKEKEVYETENKK